MRALHPHKSYQLHTLEAYIYSASLVIVVIAQSAQYVTYFNQPLSRAMTWSVVDWSMWFLLVFLVVQNKNLRSLLSNRRSKVVFLILCVLILPLVHLFATQLVYSILYEPRVSFLADISRQFSKRWFQNSVIVVALTLTFEFIRSQVVSSPDKRIVGEQSKWIIINDGKTTLRLLPREIKWITSAKNYVVLNIGHKELVFRTSLRSIFRLLKPHGFIMVSRSTIINIAVIQSVQKLSKYRYAVFSEDGKEFAIGRTFLSGLRKAILDYGSTNISDNYPKA